MRIEIQASVCSLAASLRHRREGLAYRMTWAGPVGGRENA